MSGEELTAMNDARIVIGSALNNGGIRQPDKRYATDTLVEIHRLILKHEASATT